MEESDRKRENVCGRGKSELEDSQGQEIVVVGLLEQVSLGKCLGSYRELELVISDMHILTRPGV